VNSGFNSGFSSGFSSRESTHQRDLRAVMQSEILQVEERLRAAMLAGNVAELDALIEDRLSRHIL
jgi:hypothetical protein